MNEDSDKSRSRSRDRDDRSSSRSDTRSHSSRIFSRSAYINASDYSDDGSREAPCVRDVFCVDAHTKAASKPEPAPKLKPGEAKLSLRQSNDAKARQEHLVLMRRLVFLMRQRKANAKAVQAAKKQGKLAQDKLEKHYRDELRSKYVGNFQAYIKDHNVWPY